MINYDFYYLSNIVEPSMTRVVPPILFILLLMPLAALWYFHPETLVMRKDAAMPWDVVLPLGLGLLMWARIHYIQKRAEIHTFKEPNDLITDGPFRFSRNPMYLGFTLTLLAGAFFVNTWCALLVPFAFFLISTTWYIPHEERVLRKIFGAEYDDYAWQTRRWI